jgi:hypothetical protein
MNTQRKIQLAAAAVVANGALALAFLFTGPALAGTCPSKSLCLAACPNQNQYPQLCAPFTPPGCTFFFASCSLGGGCTQDKVTCNYR